jgi:hypothetical protein
MRIIFCLTGLLFLQSARLAAQVDFTDSNLPIVVISTDGQSPITNFSKTLGTMKIIYRGEGVRNSMDDVNDASALIYNGRMEIGIRGSSSQILDKKQYSLSTLLADNTSNNNVALLDMPKEHDWVLNGFAFDPSLMRDYLCYTLGRNIGDYAPRTKYCEVVINGEYQGLYLLQEKIKVDANRVDIIKIETTDNYFPNVTGGYIIKADKIAGQDIPAWTTTSYTGAEVDFISEYPKPTTISGAQTTYIQSQFDKLEAAAHQGNNSFSDGYPSVIDIPSFVDFMILNEISANVDAYQFSTFFHKDRNGKLRAGPIWDLNLTFGNDLFFFGLDRSKTDLWQFNNGDNEGDVFWLDLFNNTNFRCYIAKRWNELTQNGAPLSAGNIDALVDNTETLISEAVGREEARWGKASDHTTQVSAIKDFVSTRITWMTTNLGSFSECASVPMPPLVISRIMYNAATSSELPDASDQEFVEITNNSDQPVNMTGVYFLGTGFVYQFPSGFVMPAHGVLQLANDIKTFIKAYGYPPYGEFTRNLASEQKLILGDGFGNVIDEVDYSNQAPWPNADGNALYLKLTDVDLDNNVAANWMASDDAIATNVVLGVEEQKGRDIWVYQSPTENIVWISSEQSIINAVKVYDLQGRPLENLHTHSNTVALHLNNFSCGIYLISVATNKEAIVRKIVLR